MKKSDIAGCADDDCGEFEELTDNPYSKPLSEYEKLNRFKKKVKNEIQEEKELLKDVLVAAKWKNFDWDESGIPRSYNQAVQNAARYLSREILTDQFKSELDLSHSEAPKITLLKEYRNDFVMAIYKRKLKYEDILDSLGLSIKKDESPWAFLDWSNVGVPRTRNQAVQNAARYLKENIMTRSFKEKYKLDIGSAPSLPQLWEDHTDFYGGFNSRGLRYSEIVISAGLKPAIILNKWAFLDWSNIGIPQTYNQAVQNAVQFMLNDILTDDFKANYGLVGNDAPKREEINESGHKDFTSALAYRKIFYNDILRELGLGFNRNTGRWDNFNWSQTGRPRTYDQAVQNATTYFLKNIFNQGFRQKYCLEGDQGPAARQLAADHYDFVAGFQYRRIKLTDILKKANLRPPIKNTFDISPQMNHIDQLSDFLNLKTHIEWMVKLKGIPWNIVKDLEDNPSASLFNVVLNNINPNIKSKRIKQYVSNYVNLLLYSSYNREDFVRNMLKFSQNKHYIKSGILSHGSAPHGTLLPNILDKVNEIVGSEIPFWFKSGGIYVSGYVDLIAIFKGTLFIIDYKPNLDPLPNAKPSESFFNAIPQIGSYALMVKRIFKITNIKCITFNKNGAWVWEPEASLKFVADLLKNVKNKNDLWIPWEDIFY